MSDFSGLSFSQHLGTSATAEDASQLEFKPFSRSTCSVGFNRIVFPSELDRDKSSTHKCSFCGKIFAYESQVSRHMRTHTGEKPYACQFCNKTFSQRIELLKHTRIHTGEKPFKCGMCNYRSAQLCNVKTHMRARHPDWEEGPKKINF